MMEKLFYFQALLSGTGMSSRLILIIFNLAILSVFKLSYVMSIGDSTTHVRHVSILGTSRHLPTEWETTCRQDSHLNSSFVSISCTVTVDDVWDLNHFRNWSAILDNDTLVSLDVMCETGASVCLPWPYRARHLDTLKIRNCTNTCYFSDFNQPEVLDIPDSLRVFEGYGVTEQVNVMDMLSVDLKSLPPALECGPMSLEVFIYRNTTADFIYPEGFFPKEGDSVTDEFVQTTRDINSLEHVCRYRNMKVYDLSQRTDATGALIYSTFINSLFPQLRTLNFSDTELQVYPSILETWRLRFEKLQTLDLSHNNISRFDLRDMSLISQGTGLIDLRYNSIRTIGIQEINSFSKTKGAVIDIRNNPFRCDCAMANFSDYLQKNIKKDQGENININYSYLWDLKCVSPQRFRGKAIRSLSKEVLCSTDTTAYVAQIAVLCVIVIILIITIIVTTRYRKEITILAFTRFNILLPCQPIENSSNKTYDAFVAYSHHDTTWVVKTLLPRLESGSPDGNNFRLCLHQRDFAVGAAIADNICQSVEASRHTILVLSRKFLESEWCLMEFRTAFHQSLIEKKKHLILVLLEDIPVNDLDADFRRCMQTWTYIHISDKLFWDRIVYSLTDKSKPKRKSIAAKDECSDIHNPQTSASDSFDHVNTNLPEQYDLCQYIEKESRSADHITDF
ncbi:toll-like receptor 6 [Haliotis cracherodii]|uniref:toll-like receptor 6 n=1 Tax=Haliotis cracherodii TaxID=6455 RepID=UPI0039E8D766